MAENFSDDFFQQLCDDRDKPTIIVKANSPKFEIVTCNIQFQDVSGTTCESIMGVSMSEIHTWNTVNEESAIQIHDALNEVIQTKEIVRLPAVRYDLPSADGTEFIQSWWQPSYEPILNSGVVEYIFCTIIQLQP